MASSNEVMAQRVHKMQKPRGAVGIPPRRCESVEVRDLFWVDGRCALGSELVLHESRGGSEKEFEVAEGRRAERRAHYGANWVLCKQAWSSW